MSQQHEHRVVEQAVIRLRDAIVGLGNRAKGDNLGPL